MNIFVHSKIAGKDTNNIIEFLKLYTHDINMRDADLDKVITLTNNN